MRPRGKRRAGMSEALAVPEALKAAVLGLVQGVTEFFPISSSAHLKALREVLGFEVEGLSFDVAVHVATLLAVLVYFRRDIRGILTSWRILPVGARIVVGTLPAVVVGLAVADVRESLSLWSLVVCWLISATYLLLTRRQQGVETYARLSYPRVLLVGVAQSAALFPGISRSGASISAGLWLGLRRDEAARFSFLLAIPAILAAALHQGMHLVREGGADEHLWLALGIATPVAFGSGMLAIHLLLRIVTSDTFHRFGWYNLAAAALFAVYLLRAT